MLRYLLCVVCHDVAIVERHEEDLGITKLPGDHLIRLVWLTLIDESADQPGGDAGTGLEDDHRLCQDLGRPVRPINMDAVLVSDKIEL